MKLSDWEEKLVDDIDIIFSGGYNEKFNEEQIEGVKQLSFLLKHIEMVDNSIIFSYDSYKFIIQGIDELGLISPYSEFTETDDGYYFKQHRGSQPHSLLRGYRFESCPDYKNKFGNIK
jgi:hypothetical protein